MYILSIFPLFRWTSYLISSHAKLPDGMKDRDLTPQPFKFVLKIFNRNWILHWLTRLMQDEEHAQEMSSSYIKDNFSYETVSPMFYCNVYERETSIGNVVWCFSYVSPCSSVSHWCFSFINIVASTKAFVFDILTLLDLYLQ